MQRLHELFQMREIYNAVIRKAMPFLIDDLIVDVPLLSFIESEKIFTRDVFDEIEVSVH